MELVERPRERAQSQAPGISTPSAVPTSDMPIANSAGNARIAPTEIPRAASAAEMPSRPTSVAVSKPSPNRKPIGRMCRLDEQRREVVVGGGAALPDLPEHPPDSGEDGDGHGGDQEQETAPRCRSGPERPSSSRPRTAHAKRLRRRRRRPRPAPPRWSGRARTRGRPPPAAGPAASACGSRCRSRRCGRRRRPGAARSRRPAGRCRAAAAGRGRPPWPRSGRRRSAPRAARGYRRCGGAGLTGVCWGLGREHGGPPGDGGCLRGCPCGGWCARRRVAIGRRRGSGHVLGSMGEPSAARPDLHRPSPAGLVAGGGRGARRPGRAWQPGCRPAGIAPGRRPGRPVGTAVWRARSRRAPERCDAGRSGRVAAGLGSRGSGRCLRPPDAGAPGGCAVAADAAPGARATTGHPRRPAGGRNRGLSARAARSGLSLPASPAPVVRPSPEPQRRALRHRRDGLPAREPGRCRERSQSGPRP